MANSPVNVLEQGSTPVAADQIGGARYQRMKLAVGADGNWDGDAQGGIAPPADNAFALFVRQIAEDNAYTQTLLNDVVQVLRSVWQMGSAAGAPSLTVRNATAADFQVTIPANSSVNLAQLAAATPHTQVGTGAPSNSANTQLVVAQSQQYHLPVTPTHIYANISI
jgi:hypothetical protein